MIMLSIIGVLVAMGLLYGAFVAFNEHRDDKFGYCFFTKPELIGLGFAGGLFLAGHYWYEAASADLKGDIVNGTVIQFFLLSVIAYFGVILLSIYFVLSLLDFVTTERK